MLESVSDYIATGVLIVLLIGTLAFVLRMFLHHRTKRLIEEEIEYYQGFIAAVEKKLSNEKFVANAKPEIIETERKKLADGQLKLQVLKESWNKL